MVKERKASGRHTWKNPLEVAGPAMTTLSISSTQMLVAREIGMSAGVEEKRGRKRDSLESEIPNVPRRVLGRPNDAVHDELKLRRGDLEQCVEAIDVDSAEKAEEGQSMSAKRERGGNKRSQQRR
jgi:hypothetical protein